MKNKKKILIITISFIIIAIVTVFICYRSLKKDEIKYSFDKSTIVYYSDDRKILGSEIETKSYDVSVDYDSEIECVESEFLNTYDDFKKYINEYKTIIIEEKNILDFFDESFFKNKSLAVDVHLYRENEVYTYRSVKVNKNNANISIEHYENVGVFPPSKVSFKFIVLDKKIQHVNFYVKTQSLHVNDDHFVTYKPIIYLYPEYDMNVSVKLKYKENITVSYPKYTNGWNVYAKTDGLLRDLDTDRNLYALYYECNNIVNFGNNMEEGFIVKKENLIEFLEEKLEILGLNEREMEEFIIYWLPKLEENEYNFIRFATDDEINKNMPIEINPKPDTLIRILMVFKGLDRQIEVKEQKLISPIRNGFTAVEWGGTEIK